MIPLISFGKLIAAIISGFVTYYGYQIWQKHREDKTFEYFFKGLLFATAVLSCYIPLPFIKNLYVIQAILYCADFFVLLCAAYLFSLFLVFMEWEKFQSFFFKTIIFIAFVLIIFYVKYFNLALTYHFQFFGFQFIGWALNLPYQLRLFGIDLIASSGLICGPLLLIKKGLIPLDPYIRTRAVLFSLGLITLSLSAIICFVYGSLSPTSFSKELLHIFFSIISAVFFFLFISYKKK